MRAGVVIGTVIIAAIGLARLLAPPTVSVVTLEERDIERVLAVVGRVRAPSRAGLGAAIAGTATEVRVREGDAARLGDVLIVLDDRELRAGVRQAEAALAEAQAATTLALAEAEREAVQARRDLERVRAVFQTGALTQQRLEQAEQRAADAASRLESLEAVASGEPGRDEPVSVATARAAVGAARARLEITRVRAPAGGTILSRLVEPGDAVAPGQTLLEIALDGPMELVVFPSEENLGQLRVGAPATASADAFSDRIFGAIIAFIAPSVDPAQGTIQVRLAVPDAPDFLRPEMTVSVNIETGRRAGASVLPDDAVQGLGTREPWVGVIRDDRLVRQPVEVGLRASGYVEIASGVSPDDLVVLQAGTFAEGQRLRLGRTGS